MIRALNTARKNNRLYVRLLTSDAGAVERDFASAAERQSGGRDDDRDDDGRYFLVLEYAPGRDLAALHKAALHAGGGGVGYYPDSQFVHMDTGRLRHW